MGSSQLDSRRSATSLAAPDDRLALVRDCYEEHGAALFRLAHTVCASPQVAALAVVTAFDLVCDSYPPPQGRTLDRHYLARLTYLACADLQPVSEDLPLRERAPSRETVVTTTFSEMPAHARALLALTLHGDHTYQEAAGLVHVDAPTAAVTIRQALRDTASRARLNDTAIG